MGGTWTLGSTTPAHGTVSINPTTGAYTYTPNAGFSGTDTIVYQISDAGGRTSTATFYITVAPDSDNDGLPDNYNAILGTNDAAVISTATVPLTETNAVLTASGTLTIKIGRASCRERV